MVVSVEVVVFELDVTDIVVFELDVSDVVLVWLADVTLDVDVKLVVVDEAVMELCVWLPVNVLVVLEVPVVSVPVVCVPEVAVAVNVPVLIEVMVTDVCVPVPLVALVV